MRKKIISLAFLAAMSLGIAIAEECQTVSSDCPEGYEGGWTGIVCNMDDVMFWDSVYCTESSVEDDLPEEP